ncbi:MAG: GIY-YIG nuclease family protein [Pseudomonadota bacterium]
MDWVVYILKCGDGSLYTGITNDLASRIEAHESGQGAKYTKGRGPFEIVYQEPCENRSAASKRETAIKKLSRAEKLKISKLKATKN